MAATRQFIASTVKAGRKKNNDAMAVQQLLMAAGETVPGGADGGWGDKSATALQSFQKKHLADGAKLQDWVDPADHVLLLMAWTANILIPMPGKGGMEGVIATHDWFVRNNIKYNPGAENGAGNRAIYGVHGDTRYAVQTTNLQYKAGPVEMDCTTYVNLMLSIYISGHCHVAPYDASCGNFGGISAAHCARDRYAMPLIRRTVTKGTTTSTANFFETAEQLSAAVATEPHRLYVIEVGLAGSGAVKHMVLFTGGVVYECTTGQSGSACISRSVGDFCAAKTGKIYYLFGPHASTR